MELMLIDYLSVELSEGGYENIFVTTDFFIRYVQAFSTRNTTATSYLFENFFVHDVLSLKINSDMGAEIETKVTQKLCDIYRHNEGKDLPLSAHWKWYDREI